MFKISLILSFALLGLQPDGHSPLKTKSVPPKTEKPTTPTREPVPTQKWEEKGYIYGVAISPDGKTVASTSKSTIRLRELSTGNDLHELSGHSEGVTALAFSPDGKNLCSGSYDKTVRIWDVASGKQLHLLEGHKGAVESLAFSPDGNTLATASGDKTIRLWDSATGKAGRKLEGSDSQVRGLAFFPDGRTLASVDGTNTRIWDVAEGKVIRQSSKVAFYTGDTPWLIHSVAVSADGKWVAVGLGNDIRVWETANGKEVATLRGHEKMVVIKALAFSPDGKTLASGSGMSNFQETHEKKPLRIWDVAEGKELFSLSCHTDGLFSLSYSSDGKRLATAGHQGVIVWDLTD
jgi:WD40 repeat protein